MSSELVELLESSRVLYLKNFLTIFGISVFILTLIYFRAKGNFPIALSVALFLNLGSFIYFNQKYQADAKKSIIPSLENIYDATYHDSPYLTEDKLNSFNIFAHDINKIKSYGYFKNDKEVVEFVKLSFVKKDTEENEIENILFDGKVVITSDENLPTPTNKELEYFEAGERLKVVAKKRWKVKDGDKFYYFYHAKKLFPTLNIFLKFAHE